MPDTDDLATAQRCLDEANKNLLELSANLKTLVSFGFYVDAGTTLESSTWSKIHEGRIRLQAYKTTKLTTHLVSRVGK